MRLSTRRAALLLLALTLLFFGPALWPADGWALGGLDMRGLFYPWLEQVRLSWTAGAGLPWWDAARFSGYPFLSNPQVAILYPPTWLAVLLPTRVGISLYLALHFWLGGLGAYLLARDWLGDGRDGFPPLLAGASFMFGGFFTARLFAGHMGLIAVHIWTPWLLWATWRAAQRPGWRSAVLAAVPLALAILAGHTTSLLYVGSDLGRFCAIPAPDRRRRAPSGFSGAAGDHERPGAAPGGGPAAPAGRVHAARRADGAGQLRVRDRFLLSAQPPGHAAGAGVLWRTDPRRLLERAQFRGADRLYWSPALARPGPGPGPAAPPHLAAAGPGAARPAAGAGTLRLPLPAGL